MHQINLHFNEEDDGLNLTGTVNFPDRSAQNVLDVNEIYIRGLAEWRHVPANIIHVNESFIANFNMMEKAKDLSKIGINFIGIKAHSNILLSFAIRAGKNGTAKVQEQLTKFFKALGASSVKFSLLNAEKELSLQSMPDSDDDSDK
jgi:hypothetical protein